VDVAPSFTRHGMHSMTSQVICRHRAQRICASFARPAWTSEGKRLLA
jgi:hypothetical protein